MHEGMVPNRCLGRIWRYGIFGDVALLKEVCHLGWALGFENKHHS